jgi:hypothetical protein
MPPLERADNVYEALDALKRECDSAPSLRDRPDEVSMDPPYCARFPLIFL